MNWYRFFHPYTKNELKAISRAKARQLKRKIKYCELCGKGGYLEVHHRNHDCMNNAPWNIVKICLKCHINQHKGEHVVHLMRKKHKKPEKVSLPLTQLFNIILKIVNLFGKR